MSKTNPRRSNGSRRTAVRRRVLAAYDTCWICGRPVDKSLPPGNPWSAEVDEVVPVSKGGSPYDFHNCRLAHRHCNQVRSNRSVAYARAKLRGTRARQAKASSYALKASEWE